VSAVKWPLGERRKAPPHAVVAEVLADDRALVVDATHKRLDGTGITEAGDLASRHDEALGSGDGLVAAGEDALVANGGKLCAECSWHVDGDEVQMPRRCC
jgi:hypothetical protein